MAQGNSGSFTLTGSQNFAVIIYWSETYNESANTHVVSITAAQLVSYNWYGFTYYPSGTLSINGTTVVTFNSAIGTHNCTIGSPRRGRVGPSPATRTAPSQSALQLTFHAIPQMAAVVADGVSVAARRSRYARSLAHQASPCLPPRWAVQGRSASPGHPLLLHTR